DPAIRQLRSAGRRRVEDVRARTRPRAAVQRSGCGARGRGGGERTQRPEQHDLPLHGVSPYLVSARATYPGSVPRRAGSTIQGMTDTLAPTRTVASFIGGQPQTDAPGGRITSTNPANSSDVVAEALLGDASTFVAAARAAREAQQAWADVPAPVRGRAIQQIGRLVEDNKEAL